jgi:hypothetical protein
MLDVSLRLQHLEQFDWYSTSVFNAVVSSGFRTSDSMVGVQKCSVA